MAWSGTRKRTRKPSNKGQRGGATKYKSNNGKKVVPYVRQYQPKPEIKCNNWNSNNSMIFQGGTGGSLNPGVTTYTYGASSYPYYTYETVLDILKDPGEGIDRNQRIGRSIFMRYMNMKIKIPYCWVGSTARIVIFKARDAAYDQQVSNAKKYIQGFTGGDFNHFHDQAYVQVVFDKNYPITSQGTVGNTMSNANGTNNFFMGCQKYIKITLPIMKQVTFETAASGAYVKGGQYFMYIFSDLAQRPAFKEDGSTMSVYDNLYKVTSMFTFNDA